MNYFDTAYIYPGSEAALGEILAKNGVREQVHIATKLPHYLIKSREGMDKLFNEIAPKYAARKEELGQGGGYTRIYLLGERRGDGAETAIIELV